MDTLTEQNILAFVNRVKHVDELIEGIKDRPDLFKKWPIVHDALIGAAQHILDERAQLGGTFASAEQIFAVSRVDTDSESPPIYRNSALPSQSYPVLLFPVRLETRFKGDKLLVRIYPDDVLIDSHDPRVTPEEKDLIGQYQQGLVQSGNEEERLGVWRALVERVGRTRAAYLSSVTEPDTLEEKPEGWSFSPGVALLPNEFQVHLYSGETVLTATGKTIPRDALPLPLMRHPASESEGPDPLFGTEAAWVSDFNAALEVGLGISVDVDGHDYFNRVVVVGLNKTDSAGDSQKLLEQLLENHHYTSGLSLLPYGTPTNNTTEQASGYTDDDQDREDSYEIENKDLIKAAGVQTWGADLARAMGVNTDVFNHVAYADEPNANFARQVQSALWPALGDYFLTHMLPNPLNQAQRRQLWLHFRDLVRAKGFLPALRVGKQPYGVLPVTGVRTWEASIWDWDASAMPGFTPVQSADFDQKLHSILKVLYQRWLETANTSSLVPRIGDGEDSDEELFQVLAMQPASVSQHLRAVVDDRYVRWLLDTFSGHFFRQHSNFGAYDEEQLKTLWTQKWSESQESAIDVLRAICEATGVSFDKLQNANIFKEFSWDEGTSSDDLGLPLVKDPTDGNGDLAYLGQFLPTQHEIPAADEQMPLLYDLLRRALVYQQQSEEYRLRDGFSTKKVSYQVTSKSKIKEVHVQEGQMVSNGDLLVTIITIGFLESIEIRSQVAGQVSHVYVSENDLLSTQGTLNLVQLRISYYADKAVRQAVQKIAVSDLAAEDLEALIRDTLDLHSHRLDAWVTSLAMKRLTAMRKKVKEGLYFGAYGWVENLRRDERTTGLEAGGYIHAPSPGQAAAGAVLRNAYLTHVDDPEGNAFRISLSSNRVRRAWRLLDGIRQGQDLGALLGYQFERGLHERGKDEFIDNFRALYPITPPVESDGNPQAPTESLAPRNVVDGNQLSRDWGEYGDPETTPVRKAEIENHWNDLRGTIQSDTGVRGELDRLADSLDGFMDLLMYESVYQEVQGNYERSGAALDAISGECLPPEPESIQTPAAGVAFTQRVCMLIQQQSVANQGPRGHAEPSLAAWFSDLLGGMDSVTHIGCRAHIGTCRDQDYQEYHPLDLNTATNRELGQLGVHPQPAQAIIAYRNQNGHFDSVSGLGSVNGIGKDLIEQLSGRVVVYQPQVVLLKDLDLAPIDFLYLCRTLPEALLSGLGFQHPGDEDQRAGETEIEQRIKYLVRHRNLLGPHCDVIIDFGRQPGAFSRSLGETLELGHAIFNVLAGGHSLTPAALRRPEELEQTASFEKNDYDELLERVTTTSTTLANLAADQFLTLSRYGIQGAIPPSSHNDSGHFTRLTAMKKAINDRTTQCDRWVVEARVHAKDNEPDYNKAIASLTEAMKALFGREFLVLPTLSAPHLDAAFAGQETLKIKDEERIRLWLQQVAQTHPAVRRLEDALMQCEAWYAEAIDPSSDCEQPPDDVLRLSPYALRVAQLPEGETAYWLALADDEIAAQLSPEAIAELRREIADNGWPRGILSLGCVVSPEIDMGSKITGLVIDEWNERIPSPTRATGISFQYDRPNSQAPQALLLAVPRQWDDTPSVWSEAELLDTVNDTLDLLKVRAVDVDALDESLGRFFPAAFLPADADNPGWERNNPLPGLGDPAVVEKGTVNGTVRNQQGGNLSGATVTLGNHQPQHTDVQGEYSLENIPVGNHTLIATHPPQYQMQTESVEVAAGQTKTVDFSLSLLPDQAGRVEGIVEGILQQGKPAIILKNATVILGERSDRTDTQGRYRFENVEAGTYTLTVEETHGGMCKQQSKTVSVTGNGETETLNFTLTCPKLDL